jgi:hypothetical protein
VQIGHIGVGFAAKRVAPRTSLTTLIVAAFFLDIQWPLTHWLELLQAHVDPGCTGIIQLDLRPYFHSLLMALVWSVVMALAYRARTRYAAGAVAVGLAVLSHWLLDFVSHDPDLSLVPGLAIRVGLGLRDTLIASATIEGTLCIAGLALYLRVTRAKGWAGHVSLWSFVGLLAFAFIGVSFGHVRHAPVAIKVPHPIVFGLLALMLWLVLVDRTRTLRTAPETLTDA